MLKANNKNKKLDKLNYLGMVRSDISDNLDNKLTKDIFIFKNKILNVMLLVKLQISYYYIMYPRFWDYRLNV